MKESWRAENGEEGTGQGKRCKLLVPHLSLHPDGYAYLSLQRLNVDGLSVGNELIETLSVQALLYVNKRLISYFRTSLSH